MRGVYDKRKNILLVSICLCAVFWLAACGRSEAAGASQTGEPAAQAASDRPEAGSEGTGAEPGTAADASERTVASAPETPPGAGGVSGDGASGAADGSSGGAAAPQTPGSPESRAGAPETSAAAETANPSGADCSIAIKTHERVILDLTAITLAPDDTVLSVTQRITREKKIPMEFSGSGGMAYVEGIDNVYEFDHGGESGWIYMVNGEKPLMSCGSYMLSAGDQIQWEYRLTLDWE